MSASQDRPYNVTYRGYVVRLERMGHCNVYSDAKYTRWFGGAHTVADAHRRVRGELGPEPSPSAPESLEDVDPASADDQGAALARSYA